MRILPLVFLALLSACKIKVEKGNSIANTSFFSDANCHLVKLAQDTLCVEYKSGTFTEIQVDSDCDNQDARYSSGTHTSHFYTYTLVTSCRSGGKVGICNTGFKQITYYDNDWTTLGAEADCTSLSGRYTDL